MSHQLPISVVVCTRNRLEQLRRCVEALAAVQTSQPWELVVVDNNSDDGTAAYLTTLPARQGLMSLKSVHEERRGLAVARNAGWRASNGAVVAFTDDDCYVRPDYIDSIVSAFAKDTSLGFVAGRVLLYDPADLPVSILETDTSRRFDPYTYIPAGAIMGANMAFRRETLVRTGGFNDRLGSGTPYPCEDIDAAAAALWNGFSGLYQPEPVVLHHHRRKSPQDIEILSREYDRGRGAYYAIYLLNRKSRAVYAKEWFRQAWSELRYAIGAARRGRWPSMRRTFRELRSAVAYVAGQLRGAS